MRPSLPRTPSFSTLMHLVAFALVCVVTMPFSRFQSVHAATGTALPGAGPITEGTANLLVPFAMGQPLATATVATTFNTTGVPGSGLLRPQPVTVSGSVTFVFVESSSVSGVLFYVQLAHALPPGWTPPPLGSGSSSFVSSSSLAGNAATTGPDVVLKVQVSSLTNAANCTTAANAITIAPNNFSVGSLGQFYISSSLPPLNQTVFYYQPYFNLSGGLLLSHILVLRDNATNAVVGCTVIKPYYMGLFTSMLALVVTIIVFVIGVCSLALIAIVVYWRLRDGSFFGGRRDGLASARKNVDLGRHSATPMSVSRLSSDAISLVMKGGGGGGGNGNGGVRGPGSIRSSPYDNDGPGNDTGYTRPQTRGSNTSGGAGRRGYPAASGNNSGYAIGDTGPADDGYNNNYTNNNSNYSNNNNMNYNNYDAGTGTGASQYGASEPRPLAPKSARQSGASGSANSLSSGGPRYAPAGAGAGRQSKGTTGSNRNINSGRGSGRGAGGDYDDGADSGGGGGDGRAEEEPPAPRRVQRSRPGSDQRY